MAILKQLLNSEEIASIEAKGFISIDLNKELSGVTVKELSDIGLTVIKTEHGDTIGNLTIHVECLRILSDRAVSKNLPIF